MEFLALLSFCGGIISLVMIIISAIKRNYRLKYWGGGLAVCFVVFMFSVVNDNSSNNPSNNNVSNSSNASNNNVSKSSTTEIDASEFRKQCIDINYDDLARNPQKYQGMKVKFSGEVVQVMEEGGQTILRINVTYDGTGYNNTVYVTYKPSKDESRILENDMVTFYGVCKGLKSYQSTIGTQITIPYIDAIVIDGLAG